MAELSDTAVLLVDPYNDFLHQDGKLTPALKPFAELNTLEHIQQLVAIARDQKLPIFYGLHQQVNASSFVGWQHMTRSNMRQKQMKFFEEGTWGAQIYQGLEPDTSNGDVVVSKHWNSE